MKLKHQLYTTQEAADLLGLSKNSGSNIICNYINKGLLEAVKVPVNGRSIWLVKKSSLQDKLDRQAKIDANINKLNREV